VRTVKITVSMRPVFFTGLVFSVAAMFAADAGALGQTFDALGLAGVAVFFAAPFAFAVDVPAAAFVRPLARGAVLVGAAAALVALWSTGAPSAAGDEIFAVAVAIAAAGAFAAALVELIAAARRDGLLVSLGLKETRQGDGRTA
jgi:hypothetical protein